MIEELIEQYGACGTVVTGEQEFPIIDIPMMSDERWKQLAEESAVKHFQEWYGRKPESVQEAFEAQRKFIRETIRIRNDRRLRA